MIQRIVTRPDFDGVVCAVLLKAALGEEIPIVWTQPSDMQRGLVQVSPGDVVANLPLPGPVALWFDHHVSNNALIPFEGVFRIAPSAAGLINGYFKEKLGDRFKELVNQTDRIDSAQLSLNEILYPERYPYVLLSMTIFTRQPSDEAYCNLIVALLGRLGIDQVMADPLVRKRCEATVTANKKYETLLKRHTTMQGPVSVSDFRGISPVPDGNRFLVYSLFPQGIVNVKIYEEGGYVVIKLGHSITNRQCRVNIGRLLSRYGGGGHKGAGACRIERDRLTTQIDEIVDVLQKNEPEED